MWIERMKREKRKLKKQATSISGKSQEEKQNIGKAFIMFWLSQSVSQLGSSMTGFALTVWAYTQTGSAMAVSLMTFASYIPFIAVGFFAGTWIDSHSKKSIMLWADTLAAVCSAAVLILWRTGLLEIYHIYLINFILGCMNAVQSPAETVAIGILVPEQRRTQASGMGSFSSNLIMTAAPALAAALMGFGGMGLVILLDLSSFLFAFFTLLCGIRIPEKPSGRMKKLSALAGLGQGIDYLRKNRGLWYIVFTMALLNFFSRLTYENVLSPMILARSGNDSRILGLVTAVVGIGGIAGGLLVSCFRKERSNVKMIYVSAAVSFLFGDLLMAAGRNVVLWCIAGAAASFPIPFINAGQQNIWYKRIPLELQGRIFAVRNALQWSTIPIAILIGGWLADYVFEPLMASGGQTAEFIGKLVGTGPGSGMAAMFLCTGVMGSLFSIYAYHRPDIRKLR